VCGQRDPATCPMGHDDIKSYSRQEPLGSSAVFLCKWTAGRHWLYY
jgi:hypothetical protein